MMKKRISGYDCMLFIMFCILAAIIIAGKTPQKKYQYIRVGIAVYDMNDTYIGNYIEQLQEKLDEYTYSGKKIIYEILDAKGNVNRQKKQFQYMCSQDFQILLLNLVNPTAAADMLNRAAGLQIPVILFNRETEAKNLTIADEIWYVGTDAKAAGAIQGDMLTQLWKEQRAQIDLNGNGKLDYVLAEGEESHFDTIRRTNGFLESSSEITLHQLEQLTAKWDRTLAYDEFSGMEKEIMEQVEAVVCHNDDMALGIYDYYKENRMQVPVILGINNNTEMDECIRTGEIYGTVDNNIEEQVTYMCSIIDGILNGTAGGFEKVWYSEPYMHAGYLKK